jgi:hypothetical protein
MTHKTFFNNFFVALAAAMSDDEFLAFSDAVLANLKRDAAKYSPEIAYLEPQVAQLRVGHQARGLEGKSATVTDLRGAVRAFLAWAKHTNVTKVFPAFPDRKQSERIDIFPGGMDTLYRADQTNILKRAKYYLEKISVTYGAQTGVKDADAQAQYEALEKALTKRITSVADKRASSVAIDERETIVCVGLYRAYTRLLNEHFEQPEEAYTYFPFPQSTGKPEDANLSSLPKDHPTD